jgi:hypothetical protein
MLPQRAWGSAEIGRRFLFGLLRPAKVSLRYILESYAFFAIGLTFGLFEKLICLGREIIVRSRSAVNLNKVYVPSLDAPRVLLLADRSRPNLFDGGLAKSKDSRKCGTGSSLPAFV